MNLFAIFFTGLTAGGISCLAMQAGLLTSALVGHGDNQKSKQELSFIDRLLPVVTFLTAKLFAHTFLGILLGGVGGAVSLSLESRLAFQVIVSLFMLATAFNLLKLHPIFRYVSLTPPKFIRRFVRKASLNQNLYAPMILGLMTVFIPCGVTQAMELSAVASGSWLSGGLIMFSFILGTFPLFILFGFGTKYLSILGREIFNKLAAFILILLSLYYLNGVFVVLDAPFSIERLLPSFFGQGSTGRNINSNEIEWGYSVANQFESDNQDQTLQKVLIVVENRGYNPKYIKVKKNLPIELTLVSQDTYSCALAFVFREYNINTMLNPTDRQTFQFTPTKSGKYTYTCSMGMYSGVLEVI